MKRAAALVALAAAVVTAAGCGGHSNATRLKIEVTNASGTRAYSLRCAPPGGTAPRPAAICAQLRREPDMLVGGPAIEHSCPPAAGSPEGFRVSGRYRGYPVDASFSSTECGWVPGQRGAYVTWYISMRGAGPGVHEREVGSAAPPRAGVTRDRARRAAELQHEARQFIRKRTKALADGTLQLQRVYVLDVRYAYRDYMGHRHLDPSGGVATTLDPATLTTTDVGYGTPWDLKGLGRPIRLRL